MAPGVSGVPIRSGTALMTTPLPEVFVVTFVRLAANEAAFVRVDLRGSHIGFARGTTGRSVHPRVDVAPAPGLTRFGRLHHRVTGGLEVRRRVLTRTRIAAGDVPTGEATPQVRPVIDTLGGTVLADPHIVGGGVFYGYRCRIAQFDAQVVVRLHIGGLDVSVHHRSSWQSHTVQSGRAPPLACGSGLFELFFRRLRLRQFSRIFAWFGQKSAQGGILR